jgi:hypothetical protein
VEIKKVYGPYSKSNGRKLVIVVYHNGQKKTISYPKFLVEQMLGYRLDENMTIDHWDGDKENNTLENFRIVPRAEHSADDTRRVEMIKLKCCWCDKEFERSPRIIRDRASKKNTGHFCSRSCAGKYTRRLQLNMIKKMKQVKPVKSKYYKRKYILSQASAEFDFDIDIDFIELLKEANDKD